MLKLDVLTLGGKSEQVRALAAAMNRRFETRSLTDRQVRVPQSGPMTLNREVLDSVITCAWALGASRATLDGMQREHKVPVGVARMIRNPGLRTDAQKELGRRRVANMRKHRKARPSAPKFITATQVGLSFQHVFGGKGPITRGAGHYTAGHRVPDAAALAKEMKSDHAFHSGKGWGGLSYEAMVADDGTIGFGNPMSRKSAAVAFTNTGLVNICCPGTTGDRMTAKQKASVKWLMDNWHTNAVPAAHRLPKPARSFGWKPHNAYPRQSTACPGEMAKDYKEIW